MTTTTIPYTVHKSKKKDNVSIDMPAKYLQLWARFAKITNVSPQKEKEWLNDDIAGILESKQDIKDFLNSL